MTFEEVDPADLPPDLPPIEPRCPGRPSPSEALAAPATKRRAAGPAREAARAAARAGAAAARRRPSPKQDKANQKSVDFEIDKEEEPAPDAKFLAEKNNRVEQETRAERTNLEKAAARARRRLARPPTAAIRTRATPRTRSPSCEDRKSKQGRQRARRDPAPASRAWPSSPRGRAQVAAVDARDRPSGSTRSAPRRSTPPCPAIPTGVLPMPEDDLQSMKDIAGRSGPVVAHQPAAVGQAVRVPVRRRRRGGRALRPEGEVEEAGAVQPAAWPGSSRRWRTSSPRCGPATRPRSTPGPRPFAAFIARMHRSIHELLGLRLPRGPGGQAGTPSPLQQPRAWSASWRSCSTATARSTR